MTASHLFTSLFDPIHVLDPSRWIAQTVTIPDVIVTSLGQQVQHGEGILDLFWRSGPMAKFVFLVLGIMSVGSWAIMVSKALQYRKADRDGAEFLDIFRRSKRFSEVNAAAGRLAGGDCRASAGRGTAFAGSGSCRTACAAGAQKLRSQIDPQPCCPLCMPVDCRRRVNRFVPLSTRFTSCH